MCGNKLMTAALGGAGRSAQRTSDGDVEQILALT
jgi:hypothetical protein